jgi:hypothetical protein
VGIGSTERLPAVLKAAARFLSRRRLVGGLAVLLAAGILSCGDPKDQSLCAVYADFVATQQSIAALDPNTTTAQQAEDAVDDAIAVTRHLRQAADTRYTDAIDRLEMTLRDVQRVLVAQDDEAQAATWRRLAEDSIEDARQAAAQVNDLIDPSCQPET